MSHLPSSRHLSSGPICEPLLKFGHDDRQPHLCQQGLDALSRLPPPISIVAFLGDGRCGKSFLASSLAQGGALAPPPPGGEADPEADKPPDVQPLFKVGGAGDPVTEGIDICVIPRSDGPDGGSASSLVVMDCEGGNNPLGKIRSVVDVVAMLCSTLTVQVVWGHLSEAQLEQIGLALAQRDRLLKGGESQLPTQRLLFTVNACFLKYTQEQFDKMLREDRGGPEIARSELRAYVRKVYEAVSFHAIPLPWQVAHAEAFAAAVTNACVPLAWAGAKLSGAQVAEFLKSMVGKLVEEGTVPIPSVLRHVIYDHLLSPLVSKLLRDFEATLPSFEDGEYVPNMRDGRTNVLDWFDQEVKGLTHTGLVKEAREDLKNGVDRVHNSAFEQNLAIGQQVRDIIVFEEARFERKETFEASRDRSFPMFWQKRPSYQERDVYSIWNRTRTLRKNGQEMYGEWQPSGRETTSPGAVGRSASGTSSQRGPPSDNENGNPGFCRRLPPVVMGQRVRQCNPRNSASRAKAEPAGVGSPQFGNSTLASSSGYGSINERSVQQPMDEKSAQPLRKPSLAT